MAYLTLIVGLAAAYCGTEWFLRYDSPLARIGSMVLAAAGVGMAVASVGSIAAGF